MKSIPRTPHQHGDWKVARMRGTRVRYMCGTCGFLDKWEKVEKKEVKPDYPNMTVAELKGLCKKRGIKGYSGHSKGGLVGLLVADDMEPASA